MNGEDARGVIEELDAAAEALIEASERAQAAWKRAEPLGIDRTDLFALCAQLVTAVGRAMKACARAGQEARRLASN